MKHIIRSPNDFLAAFRAISEHPVDVPMVLEFYEYKGKRSLDANALSHVWYDDMAKFRGDITPLDAKRECKLRYGVPILRRDSEVFMSMYDKAIKSNLTYEEKLEAMDLLNVTSLMSTKQMSEYMDTLQREYANKGLILEAK